MAAGTKSELEKRRKKNVVTKPGQLAGLGVLTEAKDKEGQTVPLQPTILSRPNALASRAFQQGAVGNLVPKSGLADRAIQANNAQANQTNSGSPASQGRYPVQNKKAKQSGMGGLGVIGG